MSFSGPVETDENAIPEAVRKFFQNRLYEALGLALLALLLCLTLALATWSPADHALVGEKQALNWFGTAGAAISGMLMRLFAPVLNDWLLLPPRCVRDEVEPGRRNTC